MDNEGNTQASNYATGPDYALDEISTTTKEQIRARTIDVRERKRSTDETAFEISSKKSVHMLARNLGAVSRMIETDISLEDKTKTEKSKDEINALSSESLRGDQMIKARQRGYVPRTRSSAFSATMLPTIKTPMKQQEASVSYEEESVKKLERLSIHSVTPSLQFEMPTIPTLSSVEATAIAIVLQDCLERLELLRYTIPAEFNETWQPFVRPIDEKYGVSDEPQRIFREDANLPPLMLSPSEKMQRDRTYAYNILKKVLSEVKQHGTFEVLKDEVDKITKMKQDEQNLEKDCRRMQSQVKQLRELLASRKVNDEKSKKDLVLVARKKNTEVDNAMYKTASKLGYVERWENGRLSQQICKLKGVEQDLLDEVNEIKKALKVEEVVSGEICAYMEVNTKFMDDEFMEWTNRYNEEILVKQQKIDDLKAKVEIQKIEIQDMKAVRDERQAFIDECLEEEERIRKEAEYQALLNRAATTIQSIWRGTMVRRQIGPYKGLRAQLRKRKKKALKEKRRREKQQQKEAQNRRK